MGLSTQLHLALPAWVTADLDPERVYDDDDMMALAIGLSRRNIEAGTGGPFGAAIFGPDRRLLAVGVNHVLASHCSLAHAEALACMLAQQGLQRARLNELGGPYTLATSAQPCCQCYGALVWAGIDRLLVGARAEDVMALTDFDEGPLPADWVGELERRGIEVQRDLQRDAACAVLRDYARSGGPRY